MLANLESLRTQVAAARREWEEMDTAHTSYAMRKKAENRYLSLLAILRGAETAEHKPARVQNPEKWRVRAEKAVRR